MDDRKPAAHMVKDLWGRPFGDNGYISRPLTTLLEAQGNMSVKEQFLIPN